MADYCSGLGHSLDILLGHLGVHGLDAAVCILGATITLGFCAIVRSAIRIAFLSCPTRR
jgi:hypothetical protein